ncbi:DMT family transporter [Desulfoscipio gibsoniae]|uniref:Putative membrane protein n=1 Tax=Desulfoscipio gibsoniae DSM 7213 TaxID=767817 RepID=R4KUN5_9FIRM|nr:DMT family transporter [Desulfoscipio gibsoniae]AGL03331.1 putative membrane protein [Desulfoscipio gibsoniae DSM 7213]
MVVGALFLTGAFMLAGTSVIAARFVAGDVGTFTIAAVSLFFAIIALLPLCRQRLRETLRQRSLREWMPLILQALFGIFLFRMFLLLGLIHTSAGEAGILTGATPAATALMAILWLKEPLYKTRMLGLISTVTGIMMIQGALLMGNGFSMEHFFGNLLVICAALCESLFNILSRISSIKAAKSQAQAFDPIVQTTLVAGIALLFCLGPALAEHPVSSLMLLETVKWLALVWYGVFVTALAFILWYAGIKRCEASTAAAFTGLMPFTSLILAVIVLGEQPGWQQWVGGFMVILGMLLTGLRRPKVRKLQAAGLP